MRVLQIAAPGRAGGLESVLESLVRGLHRRRVSVVCGLVVHADADRPPVARALEAEGVAVRRIVVPERGYLRERALVRRLVRELRPDVVHTHGLRPDVADAGVARSMGVPTVTTLHGSSRQTWRTAIYEWLQYRMLRRFDAVVAVSRPLSEELRRAGIEPGRIRVIPNAWSGGGRLLSRGEARRRLGLPEEAFVVGWVGRLIHVKGCDVFLRALSTLRDVPFHASIIGDGPERDSLASFVVRQGLQERVHFHGALEGAARLFPAFDAWVLSSRSEGTPIVLFEAMEAEVPIVATRVGGVEDVVSEEEGWLVPPEDARALARSLREVHDARASVRSRTGLARKRLREAFGAADWIERHVELYRELASRDVSGRGRKTPAVQGPSAREGAVDPASGPR